MNLLALTGWSWKGWVGIWIRNPQGRQSQSHLDYSVMERTLFVLIRILPHILGGSPASQRKIIQQATGQWFSVLWLHVLFCSYGGVQLCVMNGSLQTGGFVDLSVFGKNRRTEGYPHKSLVVVSVLLNTESNPSAENYMLKRAVIKMLCSLLCVCVCYGRG